MNAIVLPEFNPSKHWPEWKDMLGRTIRPGDVIAVGITAGRSASLSVGVVVAIHSVNSQGEPYVERWYDWKTREHGKRPSCSISFRPLEDSSNRLRRYSNRDSRVGPEKVVRLDGVTAEDLVGERT